MKMKLLMESFKKFLNENDEQDRTLDTSNESWYSRTPSWFNELVNEALEQVLDVEKFKTIFSNIYEKAVTMKDDIQSPDMILRGIMMDPSVSQEIKDRLVKPVLDEFIKHSTMTRSYEEGYLQNKAEILKNLIDFSGNLMLISSFNPEYEGIERRFRSSLENYQNRNYDLGKKLGISSGTLELMQKLLLAVESGNIGSTFESNSLMSLVLEIINNSWNSTANYRNPPEILSELKEEVIRLIGEDYGASEGEIIKQFKLSNPEYSSEPWFNNDSIMRSIAGQSINGTLGSPRTGGFDRDPMNNLASEVASHLVQQSGNTN
jgi:hypothetical protein